LIFSGVSRQKSNPDFSNEVSPDPGRRQKHGVDAMDDPVCADDVGKCQGNAVDGYLPGALRDFDRYTEAGLGKVQFFYVFFNEQSKEYVVLEHPFALYLWIVSEMISGSFPEMPECIVCRRKNGKRTITLENGIQSGLVECGGHRRESFIGTKRFLYICSFGHANPPIVVLLSALMLINP